jgi:hypothetical protein
MVVCSSTRRAQEQKEATLFGKLNQKDPRRNPQSGDTAQRRFLADSSLCVVSGNGLLLYPFRERHGVRRGISEHGVGQASAVAAFNQAVSLPLAPCGWRKVGEWNGQTITRLGYPVKGKRTGWTSLLASILVVNPTTTKAVDWRARDSSLTSEV